MEQIGEILRNDAKLDFLIFHHCELYNISHEFHLSISFDLDEFYDEIYEQQYTDEEIENLIFRFINWRN